MRSGTTIRDLTLLMLFFFTAVYIVMPQSAARIIRAEKYEEDETGEQDSYLQVIEVKVGENRVPLNETFSATNDWLKNIRIRLKNTSKRNLKCVVVTIYLLKQVDEVLPPFAAWQYALSLQSGDCGNSDQLTSNRKVILKPNQVLDLKYDDAPVLYRKTIENDNVGLFRKAIIKDATVKINSGKFKDTYLRFPSDTVFPIEPPY